jgi:hypothetical protein
VISVNRSAEMKTITAHAARSEPARRQRVQPRFELSPWQPKLVRVLLSATALCLVAACTPAYEIEAPKSFRRYERSRDFRWITPEGGLLRGREVANEPAATLDFWTEATVHHLERRGYKLQKTRSFRCAAGLDGKRIDLLVPRGGEDWLFTVGLMVDGDRILIIEAGGPWAQMHPLDTEIQHAMTSFRPQGR